MKTKKENWKTPMMVFCTFFMLFLVLFLQLMYLSLSPKIYGINMKEFATRRNTYSSIVHAKRGTIFDSNGDILALDVSSYTVIAYLDENRTGDSKIPYHVVDKNMTAEKLAPLLKMTKEDILSLLNRDVYQVELGPGGRGITEILKKKIEALKLPGIDFIESYKRFYPNGDFASYLVGYAKKKEKEVVVGDKKKKENVMVGELGVEVKFDEILRGTNGYIKYQQDRFGYKIPDTKEENIKAINGSDIYLTIDANIQRILENAVDVNVLENDPEWVTISVMDAKTGSILGSASTPSFDPNKLNIKNYENPLTSFVYEPGSVMKIFTYMCAIDKGTYKGDELYKSGAIDIEGTIVHDWNDIGWGDISYDHGFELSSNLGTAYIMKNFLTKEELKNCFEKYGFGKPTDIELTRELPGKIVFNYPLEVVTASFGQGILTTPIQHLQALSIIANDGHMVKPNIIEKIVQNGEEIYKKQTIKSDQIVKSQSVEEIKRLMYNAINNVEGHAIGLAYRVDGVDIIGKTGTAEIAENGHYLTGWNDKLFSFSGMFPKENPEIIIFASVKRPKNGSNLGIKKMSQTVMESIAKYKGLISGSVSDEVNKYDIDNYINMKVKDVEKLLKNNGVDVIILGDGDHIINQYPKKGNTILTGDKLILLTNSKNILMPNLVGYSRIDSISLLNLIDVDFELEGYGRVIEQNIIPGTKIDKKIVLKLKSEEIKKE